MKFNSTTALIILATLVVGAGAYWYFFTGTGNQPPLTSGASKNEAEMHFQALASELQPITFDTGIFSDARFNALVDLTTQVSPEPSGRTDPFAPIPGVSGM